MNKSLLIAVIIVVFAATLGAWYFFRPGTPPAPAPEVSPPSPAESLEAAPGFASATGTVAAAPAGPIAGPRQAPAGHKEYRNTTYRFSLFYPQDLTLHEYDEGGGASTITFENAETVQGFQIFIVPYAGTQVTSAQFKGDVPSGVMKDPLNITIDGATATSFFSENALLGETAAIWVIRGGYLLH